MDEKEESFFWLEEYSGRPLTSVGQKRKVKSKKVEFVGWGSKQLIEFLESIGQDTTKQISQRDATDIILKYVNDKNLVNPAKKKRIICDEWLFSIFGRKTISRIKVYDLLETHYAENQDSWDDDFLFSSEEETLGEKQKSIISERKTYQKRKVVETPKSCFAAIIPENIKMVYLKKSLVVDLLKDPERFEAKVVGSFVRIKSDPNFYLQKNPHQLVLVKGLKASGNHEINANVLFQVSNFVKDVSISMLSDDDFCQEECEDLHERVKNGKLLKPTIAELEAKARILHEDITKHWIAKEIALLQRLIDRANEKGWRRELFEYMEKRELLQTPEEQSRLLHEDPKVIAEEIEPETSPQDLLDDKQENRSSPVSTVKETLEFPSDTAANRKISVAKPYTIDLAIQCLMPTPKDNTGLSSSTLFPSVIYAGDNGPDAADERRPSNIVNMTAQPINLPEKDGPTDKQSFVNISNTQVINLSDEEDDAADDLIQVEVQTHSDMNSLMWHYSDPQGVTQGPFSLASLEFWKGLAYFSEDFKVWKTGEDRRKAVLLTDILRQRYPR